MDEITYKDIERQLDKLEKLKNENNKNIILIEKNKKYVMVINKDITNEELDDIKKRINEFLNDENQNFLYINGKTCDFIEL